MKKVFFGIVLSMCVGYVGSLVQAATYSIPHLSLNRTRYVKANKKKIYNYKYYYRRNWRLPRTSWDTRFQTRRYRFSPKFKQSDYAKWRMMSGDSHDLSATEWNQSNSGGITRAMARQAALEESAARKSGQMCGDKFMKNTEVSRWACECDNSLEYADREWECDNKRQELCQFKDSSLGEYLISLERRNRCCICDDGWKCEYSTVAGGMEQHECSWEVEDEPVEEEESEEES